MIREESIGNDGTVHEVTSNVMHYLTQLDKAYGWESDILVRIIDTVSNLEPYLRL